MQQWEYAWVTLSDLQEAADMTLTHNRMRVEELGTEGYELVSAIFDGPTVTRNGHVVYVLKRQKTPA